MAPTARPRTLLTLDRGHTTLDCSWWTPDGSRRARFDPAAVDAVREWCGEVPVRAAGCSVVPDGFAEVSRWLGDSGVPLQCAGDQLPCPLRLTYRDPGQLGPDRWVTAVAAVEMYGTSVVVDCGTAVTVDLVRDDRVFAGGAIGAGAAAMARGLADGAPRLPKARLDEELVMLPDTSEAAVDAGVQLGFCGSVEGLVARVAATAGGDPKLVLTGGDAELVLRHSTLPFVHVPDLLHRGLRALVEAS